MTSTREARKKGDQQVTPPPAKHRTKEEKNSEENLPEEMSGAIGSWVLAFSSNERVEGAGNAMRGAKVRPETAKNFAANSGRKNGFGPLILSRKGGMEDKVALKRQRNQKC